jgi:hypothetical protein
MRARPSAASQRPSEGLTKLPNVERPEASPGWNGETWKLRIDGREPTMPLTAWRRSRRSSAFPFCPTGTHRPDSVSPEC